MASLFSMPHNNKSPKLLRDEVYVGAVPLRAAKGPAQWFFSNAHSLNLWDLQHYMVILRPTSLHHQTIVYDFQPQDPENIYVALAALSRRQVPGVVQERKLSKLPKSRCWFVGLSNENSLDMAHRFNNYWQTELKLGEHDCRHYTNGGVQEVEKNAVTVEPPSIVAEVEHKNRPPLQRKQREKKGQQRQSRLKQKPAHPRNRCKKKKTREE